MSNNYFYKIPHYDARISDAEQRITEDTYGVFYQGFGNMLIGAVRPVSKLIWFTYRIGGFLGHRWSIGLWISLVGIMAFLKLCMPDYHHIHREHSKRDAKYKKIHARVKLCAESIAFFGGGDREKQMATKAFESVQELEWEREWGA